MREEHMLQARDGQCAQNKSMDSPPPPCPASCDSPAIKTPNTGKCPCYCIAGPNASERQYRLDQRASSMPSGSRALLPLELMDQAHNYPHMVYMGGCVTCGQPTGNFCDPCVNAGRTFEVPAGQIMAGSPICGPCEDFHCYVCAGIVPPGPIGQPTVPIVTLAPVMQYADDTVLPAGP